MQSVYNKIHLLEALIEEQPNINVICITETWMNKEKLKLLNINNYTPGSSFCREQHEGGGVCILVKSTLNYIERTDIKSQSLEYIFETCAIEIPEINLLIINLYWPDSNREVEVFYTCLEKLLKLLALKDNNKKVIFGGDFNVNFLTNNKAKRTLSNLMLTYNFHQKVKGATRVTASSSTCLDLLFTNFKIDTQVVIDELGFSDHRGILFSTPLTTYQPKQLTMLKRRYTETNINKFKDELLTINWDHKFKLNKNINENYNIFKEIVKNALNKCIPLKPIKIKFNSKKTHITSGIKISCRNKRLLKMLISQSRNEILQNNYKKYCTTLKKAVHKSKKLNNISKFNNSENKSRSMWQIIHEETNKKTQKIKNNVKLKINNTIIHDPKLVANSFNIFFASIGNSDENPGLRNNSSQDNIIENTFYLHPTDEKEILNVIKNLKNKKSCGIDEIPPFLLKRCANELTTPYTKLVNKSFSEGIFPTDLKISLIKPIHKKGDVTDPNNYRPISLLPTSTKIFETVMVKRIYSFYEKFNIFDKSQNGFRKNHSTTLAIYKYLQKILEALNNKKYAVGLLLDMSKAYDRVCHKTLLSKLYKTGIRGVAHKWFKSYLENRVQFVEIENTNLETCQIQHVRSDKILAKGSIPQGSVLGCILFLIYINDLPSIIDDHCILFADDISVIIPCSNTNELQTKLDTLLNTIVNWLECHNLQLNLNKTKLIQFKPYQKTALKITYNYKDKKLETVTSATLLGIDLDTHINWKPYMQKLTNKLSSFIYALRHLKRVTDFKTALTAYYAYAHSRLSYGIVLWGNCTDVNDIFILQKKCLRILVNIDQTMSCKPFFEKHEILTLTSIYIFEACKFVRKHPNLYSPIHTIKRNDRNLHTLKVPFSKLKLISSGPHSMVIKIYNHIPNSIKNIDKATLFNKHLKNFLIHKSYYNIKEFFDDKMT